MVNLSRVDAALAYVKATLGDKHILIHEMQLVGSTYISDKQTSDIDVLVLCDRTPDEVAFKIQGLEYGGSSGIGTDEWGSWKGQVTYNGHSFLINILLTKRAALYYDWCTAAEVCRFLHLKGHTVPSGVVHGIHEIIMEESDAITELGRRNY